MTRLRQRLASWLLDLAVRVEPKSTTEPKAAEQRQRPNTLPLLHAPVIDRQARQAAADLRRLASSVEDGHVVGFRVVWHGAPHPPEVWFYVPNAIGEA